MPEVRTVSFRDQTMGGVNDLLVDEGLNCAHSQNIIGYLAGELLAYREEGISLSPTILFCDDIGGVLSTFPGSVHYRVGEKALNVSSARGILKDCASLASKGWFVFIERKSGDLLSYGVACFESLPGSIGLHEGLLLAPDRLGVLLRRINDKTIRISGSQGSQLTCLFSTSRGEDTDSDAIRKFAVQCSADVSIEADKDLFVEYLTHTLDSLLQSSHGCILACAPKGLSDIGELKDHVPLSPGLDLHAAFAAFRADGTAGNLAALQSYYGLAEGLFRSDGIVVFNHKGHLTAFRAFYRPGESALGVVVVGGARRRAFEGARSLVGKGLTGLLFRSQDGLTLFEGVANV